MDVVFARLWDLGEDSYDKLEDVECFSASYFLFVAELLRPPESPRHSSADLHYFAHPLSMRGLGTTFLQPEQTRAGSSFQNSISVSQCGQFT